MKILHFAFDEKVIPLTHALYEDAFSGKNQWKIFSPNNEPIKFVKSLTNIEVVPEAYFNSQKLQKDLIDIDCIVIHYLFPIHKNILKIAPKNIVIVWHSWGRDYADLIAPFSSSVTLKRSSVIEKYAKILSFFDTDTSLKSKVKRLKNIFIKHAANEDFLYQRIDVVSIQKEIYPVLQKAIPQLKAKNHYLSSYTIEDTYSLGPNFFNGDHILLGNSAYASNNHIEAILLLKKLDSTHKKVIVPLNYGSTRYANMINSLGKKHLGKHNFESIMQFLPLEDYYKKIESCGIVIMNHTRQQARGNINTAIYKGAKVFLREENPIYSQCVNLGIHVFSIQELEKGTVDFTPLTETQIKFNKQILTQYWKRSQVINSIKQLEDFVLEKKTTVN